MIVNIIRITTTTTTTTTITNTIICIINIIIIIIDINIIINIIRHRENIRRCARELGVNLALVTKYNII